MIKKKVIIIDDSNFVVNNLVRFFTEQLSFDVVATANDGECAVDLYKKNHPDLITLDLMMPKKDGVTALTEILSIDADAKVMMISAVRGDKMLRCMGMGAKGYMQKPLQFQDPDYVADFIETVGQIVGN